jgi:hypothetical protein
MGAKSTTLFVRKSYAFRREMSAEKWGYFAAPLGHAITPEGVTLTG